MEIGLFFGSFNPVHIGHMAMANYFVEFTHIDELWFVVSPHNPLKDKTNLLEGNSRLKMVEKAVADDKRFKVCDIEFSMPQPSYTIDTLKKLKKLNPKTEFAIFMGSDGLPSFEKWKNYKEIIKNYTRYIYPRYPGFSNHIKNQENIKIIKAPRLDITSTFLRSAIAKGKDIRHFLPRDIYEIIIKKGYYK